MDLSSWEDEPPQGARAQYERQPHEPARPRKPQGAADSPKRVRIMVSDRQNPEPQSHQQYDQGFQDPYQPLPIVPHSQVRESRKQNRALEAHRSVEHPAHNLSPDRNSHAEAAAIGLVPQNQSPVQRKAGYRPGKYHCVSKQSEVEDILFARQSSVSKAVIFGNKGVAKEILAPAKAPSYGLPSKQSPTKVAEHPAFNEKVTKLVDQQSKHGNRADAIRRSKQKAAAQAQNPSRQLFRDPAQAPNNNNNEPGPAAYIPSSRAHPNPPHAPSARFIPEPPARQALEQHQHQHQHQARRVPASYADPSSPQYPPAAARLGPGGAVGLEQYLSPPRWPAAQARDLNELDRKSVV